MSKNWYPVLNYETCVECGACFDKCKHGVYEKHEERPVVVNPDGCLEGCHGCGNLCPTQSIEYVGDTGSNKTGDCGCGCNSGCSSC